MTQAINQFAQSVEQGQLDLAVHQAVMTCKIAADETATLVAGDAVKIDDESGKVPVVVKATADNDAIFGYVVRNLMQSTFEDGDMVEVAYTGSIMYMTAGAVVARGAKVESDVSETEVITASANPVVGIAIDAAAASGDLIRVLIITPASTNAGSFTTLNASGATALGSTLAVTGVSTLTGNLVANGNIIANGLVIDDVNDYDAGAGALPITKPVIALTTSGAEALTLADGVEGQRLTIVMVVDGGDATLTPANLGGSGTTITFDNSDSVDLIFLGDSWWVIGTPSATVA